MFDITDNNTFINKFVGFDKKCSVGTAYYLNIYYITIINNIIKIYIIDVPPIEKYHRNTEYRLGLKK